MPPSSGPMSTVDRAPSASSLTAVRVWLLMVAALVFLMVLVGGATRLTDSGLSITEWRPILGAIPPLTAADWQDAFDKYRQIPQYHEINRGMSLEDFKFIYWWEWGHRFLGRIIGVVFAVPLAFFWLTGRLPRRLGVSLTALLALGALQGFVGWYMVQSGLVGRIDVSHYRLALHLTIAIVILGLLLWTALRLTPPDPGIRLATLGRGHKTIAGVLLAAILVQIVAGGFVAGLDAGLTYNTWPLMDGRLIPAGLGTLSPWYLNLLENVTTVQFTHRMIAYALILVAAVHAWSIWRTADDDAPRLSGLILVVGLLAQAALGVLTLLAVTDGKIPVVLGVAHQGGAAVVFAIGIWHLHYLTRRA